MSSEGVIPDITLGQGMLLVVSFVASLISCVAFQWFHSRQMSMESLLQDTIKEMKEKGYENVIKEADTLHTENTAAAVVAKKVLEEQLVNDEGVFEATAAETLQRAKFEEVINLGKTSVQRAAKALKETGVDFKEVMGFFQEAIYMMEAHNQAVAKDLTSAGPSTQHATFKDEDLLPFLYFKHSLAGLGNGDLYIVKKNALRIIRLRPRWWQGHYLLAEACMQLNQVFAAKKAIEHCLTLELYILDEDNIRRTKTKVDKIIATKEAKAIEESDLAEMYLEQKGF